MAAAAAARTMSTEVAADRRRRVEGAGLAGECVAGVVVSKVIVRLRGPGVRERGGSGDVLRAQVAWHDERSMLVWVCCAERERRVYHNRFSNK